MNQRQLNDFKRKYFNSLRPRQEGYIVHDSNVSPTHRRLVNEICDWLASKGFTYYTRVYTNWGEIIDIVAPDLPRPFIEVRVSELEKTKEYLSEHEGTDLDSLRTYIDSTDPFKLL